MSRDLWQPLQRHPRLVDITLAVALCGIALLASTLDTNGRAPEIVRPISPSVVPVAAIAAVALLWHRSRPRAVLAVTTGCGIVFAAMGYDISAPLVGPTFVAAYSVGWRADRDSEYVYPPLAGIVLLTAALVLRPGPLFGAGRVTLVAGFLLAGAFAEMSRSRKNYLAAMRARAELAEHTREDEARHRVAEERVRIARELHDIVAHHMALAHAQASTAAYLVRTKPEQAQQVLDQLAATTASALRELGATVGLLRREDDPEAPLEPAPGLSRLPELLASFEQMGLRVSLSVVGEPQKLSPGVDLTAYRIVQEALTNVTKHAPAAAVSVRLAYSLSLLTITVTNDADGAQQPGEAGFGLIGMNERALSVGGQFLAGSRPGGGFEVSTRLPLEPRGQEN
ncbi:MULTISPECIES: sensor histidine kinase [unclassified Nocardia]|uniref:sensor histidine kinase n=1 Tax=unclassified Nocardia TaxID=2637762 RepID=UPI001CE43CB8|nr:MULTISPECIES: sensor histidine kinase [unclassified Nocardia]